MTANLGKRTKDITGMKFGSLTAIEFAHVDNRQAYWKFKCDCGNIHTARSNTVNYVCKKYNDPQLPSCGCIELARKTKHGYRKAKDTHPAYRAYRGMMSRCYDTNNSGYKWYGAIGVTVCNEWKDNPEAFVKWSIENGWSKGLHIDKDILCKAKGIYPHIYSPNTCQWVKPQVNVSEATNRNNYGKHPNIRLSQEQVDKIIELYNSNDKITYVELAEMYGLKSPSSIARLIKLANKGAD